MAKVSLNKVSKLFKGNQPLPKKWWQFWKKTSIPQEVWAVKELELDIKDGEFLVLVGPSGCGKTTTLRMVAGLEEVSQGEIFIGERLVNDISPKDRDIAMVFQNYALYPHMNVYENMAFGLRLRKIPAPEIEKRVSETAALLDIKHLLYRKPKELSGGQKQRVAMGRAIVRSPKVYLMDEPLSNLDAKLRVQMRAELQKLHHKLGVTTIYVTHDQTEAMTLGDRLVLMKDGLSQQVGSPLDLYDKPVNQFVAGFIGSPAMNFVTGVLTKTDGLGFKASGFTVTLPPEKTPKLLPFADQEVTLGIRPEHIREETAPANSDWMISAGVEVIEPMGNEAILYLKTGNDQLISRLDAHTRAKAGETLKLYLQIDKAHFFSQKDQKSLLYSPEN